MHNMQLREKRKKKYFKIALLVLLKNQQNEL